MDRVYTEKIVVNLSIFASSCFGRLLDCALYSDFLVPLFDSGTISLVSGTICGFFSLIFERFFHVKILVSLVRFIYSVCYHIIVVASHKFSQIGRILFSLHIILLLGLITYLVKKNCFKGKMNKLMNITRIL